MPAPLAHPCRKIDVRIREDDLAFLGPFCAKHNTTTTEFIREAVHAATNAKRKALNLPQT